MDKLTSKPINSTFWLLTGLLAFTLVLSNFVVNFAFYLDGFILMLSVFTYPFVYFFLNIITIKYGAKKTFMAIVVALTLQLLAYIINNTVSGYIVAEHVMLASANAYMISTLINLSIFYYLFRSSNISFWSVLGTFLLVNLIDTLSFQQVLNTSWHFSSDVLFNALISAGIKTVVSIIPAFIIHRLYANKQKK